MTPVGGRSTAETDSTVYTYIYIYRKQHLPYQTQTLSVDILWSILVGRIELISMILRQHNRNPTKIITITWKAVLNKLNKCDSSLNVFLKIT